MQPLIFVCQLQFTPVFEKISNFLPHKEQAEVFLRSNRMAQPFYAQWGFSPIEVKGFLQGGLKGLLRYPLLVAG